MFQRFDEETRKILKKAKLEMQELKHPFVGTEHLLLSILSFKDLKITKKLNELGINYNNFKEELIATVGIGNSLNSYFIYTPLLKRVIEGAILDSKDDNLFEVNINALFVSMLDEGEGVGIRLLGNLGVNIDELYLDFLEKDDDSKKGKGKKKLSIYDHGVDLVEKAREGKIDPVIGREAEINRLIEILLRRNKNNPLLIGEAGVGKTAIVEALAFKIYKKEVPDSLLDKKILSVSMANLVAGTKYRGEFEERISKIIKEIENNPNLIIFIDEMHSLVGAGGAEGAIDASNIFKPALARGKFRLIGATTIQEYKESIEKDKALNRRFQTILIKEPDLAETLNILKKIKPIYEKFHGVIISDEMLESIVNLSNKYIFDRRNPDKAIDVLDEVCTSRSLKKDKLSLKLESLKKELLDINKRKNDWIIKHEFSNASKEKENEIILEDKINKLYLKEQERSRKIVTLNDIARVIQAKSNVPVYEVDKESLKNLKSLEGDLKNIIIGQDVAIEKLCYETKKIKLGLKNTDKPISFLFTGKSGVGKTSLAREYAKLLHMHLIRLDMSEYKESHTTSKILGSPPGYIGYESGTTVLDEVKNNPFSVILIDEIEKASSSVINLFLQILDEGFITSSNHEKVYFNHTILIMTSNITSNVSQIGFNEDKSIDIKNKLMEVLKPEFLNRINHIIPFNELSDNVVRTIIKNEIVKVKKKFRTQDIKIQIDERVVEDILKQSNYMISGARGVKKIIEDKIDNLVIDNILNGISKVNIKSL